MCRRVSGRLGQHAVRVSGRECRTPHAVLCATCGFVRCGALAQQCVTCVHECSVLTSSQPPLLVCDLSSSHSLAKALSKGSSGSPAKSGSDKWKKKGASKKVTLSKDTDDGAHDDVGGNAAIGDLTSGSSLARPTTARGVSSGDLFGDTGSPGITATCAFSASEWVVVSVLVVCEVIWCADG
jgi:hypothetical protein